MNIKLSNKEASEILRAHFFREAQPSVVLNIQSIEIESAPPQPVVPTVELAPIIRAIHNAPVPYGGSRKFAAIKAIRAELESQGLHVGLADAKLFVEQFLP